MSTEQPTGHRDRTITAFFDNRGAAEKARADVVQAGIPSNLVTIVEGHGGAAASPRTTSASGTP